MASVTLYWWHDDPIEQYRKSANLSGMRIFSLNLMDRHAAVCLCSLNTKLAYVGLLP